MRTTEKKSASVVLVRCTIKERSDKAYQVEFNGQLEWIPKSQIRSYQFETQRDGQLKVNATGNLEISQWINEKTFNHRNT